MTTESTESKEWITDGVRYIASEPYGLESGKRVFILYTANFCEKSNGRVYRLGIPGAVLVLIPLKKHWTVTDFTIKEWDMDSSQSESSPEN